MGDEVPLYDDFGADYDVMVSWQERLAREEPFFAELFQRARASRVLDAGCATGGHTVHFARMGMTAVGADPSEEMVRIARARAAGIQGVTFVQAGFGELSSRVGGTFDVAICVGNTLPHVVTRAGLEAALTDLAGVLRPGGILALQLLNYDRILSERKRFLGVSSGARDGAEYLFFRFYDFLEPDEPQVDFNVVTLTRRSGSWNYKVGTTRLRAIVQAELAESLTRAGFGFPEWYGSHQKDPFDSHSSNDLVAVANRL